MVVVKTVEEFAKQNEEQLKLFMRYKTGIYDEDIIRDTVQEFYIRLITTRALENFDEEKGKFDTYIANLFCWLLPSLRKIKFRNIVTKTVTVNENGNEVRKKVEVIHEVLSTFKYRSDKIWGKAEDDVWDHVGNYNSHLAIDALYNYSHVYVEEERKLEDKYKAFVRHIRETEPHKRAERMILVLNCRNDGCRSKDIARMLGISDNMVKIIKNRIRDKYFEWNEVVPA